MFRLKSNHLQIVPRRLRNAGFQDNICKGIKTTVKRDKHHFENFVGMNVLIKTIFKIREKGSLLSLQTFVLQQKYIPTACPTDWKLKIYNTTLEV